MHKNIWSLATKQYHLFWGPYNTLGSATMCFLSPMMCSIFWNANPLNHQSLLRYPQNVLQNKTYSAILHCWGNWIEFSKAGLFPTFVSSSKHVLLRDDRHGKEIVASFLFGKLAHWIWHFFLVTKWGQFRKTLVCYCSLDFKHITFAITAIAIAFLCCTTHHF